MTVSATPPALDALLQEAGRTWDDPPCARALIEQALRDFPDAEAAYVAAYRYYFYQHDHLRAVEIAEQCLVRLQAELGLPDDWRTLTANGQDFADFERPRHRFLLFALSAYAYLLARLGRQAEADQAYAVLRGLDPADRFGADRWRAVLSGGPDAD